MVLRYFAVAAFLALAPLATAQAPAAYSPPRTPDGRPDLQGVWATRFLTPLERPKDFKDLVPSSEQARDLIAKTLAAAPKVSDPDLQLQNITALASVNGALRSSLMVAPGDGQLPFTEKGTKLAERAFELEDYAFDNPEERPTYERCIVGQGQPPMRPIPVFIPNLIVQTPTSIAIATEDVGNLRIIHVGDQPPPPDAVRSFEGWSAGRWEGETLVVETTHSRSDDNFRSMFGRPILVEADSKVVERFTRISETELLYQFTVEDADLYAKPWLAEYVFKLEDTPWYEYACHEANYSIVNGLVAARLGRQTVKKKD